MIRSKELGDISNIPIKQKKNGHFVYKQESEEVIPLKKEDVSKIVSSLKNINDVINTTMNMMKNMFETNLSKHINSVKVGSLLLEEKLINEQQLQEALDIQKNIQNKKIGDILIGLEYITKEQLDSILKKQKGD